MIRAKMFLRSLWYTLNGSKRRRAQEWERVVERAEQIRRNRSEGAKKGWAKRKAKAAQEVEGVPV